MECVLKVLLKQYYAQFNMMVWTTWSSWYKYIILSFVYSLCTPPPFPTLPPPFAQLLHHHHCDTKHLNKLCIELSNCWCCAFLQIAKLCLLETFICVQQISSTSVRLVKAQFETTLQLATVTIFIEIQISQSRIPFRDFVFHVLYFFLESEKDRKKSAFHLYGKAHFDAGSICLCKWGEVLYRSLKL